MPLAAFLKYRRTNKLFMHKTPKSFLGSAFSFVARLHNVGLMLIPISEQYYPVSNRVTKSEIGPHFLIKTGHVYDLTSTF